jgi:deoxyribonuclease-4
LTTGLFPPLISGICMPDAEDALIPPGDFLEVLDKIEDKLGYDRMKNMHVHFSRVEFTSKGEKKHWTYADIQYGLEFSHLAGALLKKGAEPIIICESRGTMAEDALTMMNIYREMAGGVWL